LDGSGNVYVVGTSVVAVDFGAGSVPAGGGSDGWIAKYASANGGYLWARRFGGTGNEYANAVAVDASNNVYLAGEFESATVDFGGQSVNQLGNGDGVIAKYSSTGGLTWVRDEGGNGADWLRAVTPSGSSVYEAGYFYGSATFDGTAMTSAGMADGVVIRASA
jgi:hypothetical protein